MSIEMPAGLQWLSYLAGSSWPKGDEDALFALSQDWADAASALNAVIAPLRAACDTATGNYGGSGADQMRSQFEQFFSGDSSVEKIVEGKMSKFYEEVCLYEQPFIKDQTVSISQLIATKIGKLSENISVRRFARFKVGDVGETIAVSKPEQKAE